MIIQIQLSECMNERKKGRKKERMKAINISNKGAWDEIYTGRERKNDVSGFKEKHMPHKPSASYEAVLIPR